VEAEAIGVEAEAVDKITASTSLAASHVKSNNMPRIARKPQIGLY